MTTTARWYPLVTLVRVLVASALGIASLERDRSGGVDPLLALAFAVDSIGLVASLGLVPRMQKERATHGLAPMRTTGVLSLGAAAIVLDWLVAGGNFALLGPPLAALAGTLFFAVMAQEVARPSADATPSMRAALPGVSCGTIAIAILVGTFALRILSGAGAGRASLAMREQLRRADEVAVLFWWLQAVAHAVTVRRAAARASAAPAPSRGGRRA